jgi:predicted ester cyclase
VHSADAAFHSGEGAPLVGLLAHTTLYAGWLQGHPDLQIAINVTVAQGDRVAVLWTATGTQVASYAAAGVVPPNGRLVTFAGITIYRIACGQIAESWEHFNNLDLYRQVIEDASATPVAG